MFGVWCRVSGGVTGTREAWLKHDNKRAVFNTLEEAQEEASELQRTMGKHSLASFRYTAQELD